MMGYFVGNWKLKGTMKVSPTAPGGPFTSTEHSEWVPGSFFVETHSSMQSPMGNIRGMRVMEYNPADKVYTYNAYNSLGTPGGARPRSGQPLDVDRRRENEWRHVNGRYTITRFLPLRTRSSLRWLRPAADGAPSWKAKPPGRNSEATVLHGKHRDQGNSRNGRRNPALPGLRRSTTRGREPEARTAIEIWNSAQDEDAMGELEILVDGRRVFSHKETGTTPRPRELLALITFQQP